MDIAQEYDSLMDELEKVYSYRTDEINYNDKNVLEDIKRKYIYKIEERYNPQIAHPIIECIDSTIDELSIAFREARENKCDEQKSDKYKDLKDECIEASKSEDVEKFESEIAVVLNELHRNIENNIDYLDDKNNDKISYKIDDLICTRLPYEIQGNLRSRYDLEGLDEAIFEIINITRNEMKSEIEEVYKDNTTDYKINVMGEVYNRLDEFQKTVLKEKEKEKENENSFEDSLKSNVNSEEEISNVDSEELLNDNKDKNRPTSLGDLLK